MKIGDIVRIKHTRVIVLIRHIIRYDDKEWFSCVSLQYAAGDHHAGMHTDHKADELEPLGMVRQTEVENIRSELELAEELVNGMKQALFLAYTDEHYDPVQLYKIGDNDENRNQW